MSVKQVSVLGGWVFLFLVSFIIVLIGVGVRQLLSRSRRKNLTGTIDLGAGKQYPYEIGELVVSTTVAYGIQVRFPVAYPNILVDSHHNDAYGKSMVFAADSAQRIELEGDFYKDFAVYAPKGYELWALQLLAPDVMQLLMTDARRFDMELYGSTLNLYSRRDPRDDADLADELKAVVSGILLEAQKTLTHWKPVRSGDEIGLFLAGRGSHMNKIGRRQLN